MTRLSVASRQDLLLGALSSSLAVAVVVDAQATDTNENR